MNLEEYNKLLELVSHYSRRIHSWVNKRSGCTEEFGENCFFSPNSKTVTLREDAEKFAKGHEYGHAFWHNLVSKDCIEVSEFFEYVLLFEELSLEEVGQELSKMGIGRCLIPFTDFLSSVIEIPNEWYKHSKEYWDKCNHKEERAKDEAFASMFGYLYEGNAFRFEKMQKYFPKFVDSCLNLIEKGLLT